MHSFSGFTTGEWVGDRLTARMTHMKRGIMRRNGVPLSDRATLTLHFVRHGDVLTIMGVTDDPIYLEEPLVQTGSYRLNSRGIRCHESDVLPFTSWPRSISRGGGPHFCCTSRRETFGEDLQLPLDRPRGAGQSILSPGKTEDGITADACSVCC